MKPLPIRLPSGAEFKHLLDPVHEQAIRGAAAANRPLLVRGEPGLGKSQLAYAAASLLGRKLISYTISASTEAQDLLWSFDAVKRLAESQVAAQMLRLAPEPPSDKAAKAVKAAPQDPWADAENRLRDKIDVKKFLLPGPLWWAIDWESAEKANHERLAPSPASVSQSADDWKSEQGIVILIDEIDKAESSVPNGLLEIFGARQLQPPGYPDPIVSKPNTKSPLVIITTNEERMLPTAFIRRCFVLELELLPCVDNQGNKAIDGKKDAFIDYFISLGKAHFDTQLPETLYKEAAEMLFEDRFEAIRSQAIWRPGPAEYVDLLCAVKEWEGEIDVTKDSPPPRSKARRTKRSDKEYKELCQNLRRFALQKNVSGR
jgi:MoxR-like ATPase